MPLSYIPKFGSFPVRIKTNKGNNGESNFEDDNFKAY